MSIDGACFTLRSRGFQRVGAALANARFPNVSSRHLGELNIYWSSEWRGAVVVHLLISMLRDIVEHGHSMPCRWGAEFCNSSLNTGLIWSNLRLLYIMTPLSWQHCSRSMWDCFAPYNRLLQQSRRDVTGGINHIFCCWSIEIFPYLCNRK